MIEDALSFLWRSLVGPTKEDDENWMEDGRKIEAFKYEKDEERIRRKNYDQGLRNSPEESRK